MIARQIKTLAFLLTTLMASLALTPAFSQSNSVKSYNSIEDLELSQQGKNIIVRLKSKKPLTAVPGHFSMSNPARIIFDLPNMTNGLGRSHQAVDLGNLRSINIVQVGDRTRLVMNVSKLPPFSTRIEDKKLTIILAEKTEEALPVKHTEGDNILPHSFAGQARSIRDINFRRGSQGEARIMVDLSDPDTNVDIHQQGQDIVLVFPKTSLPENLRRRLDVTDFATPVTAVTAAPTEQNVRMVISPRGLWEHNAYQSDNQFIVEVRRVIEDPNKLVQGARGAYQGDKLSLNFQSIDIRAVLQVIADFTNLNIITSDSVAGNLTLRLKNVPWDQALDIILQSKGLGMRKTGNVILVAPQAELAAKEKLDLESRQQISELEPTHSETFQLSYQKAEQVQKLLTDKSQPILSKRGSVLIDERTNKLFILETPSRLEDVRRLIAEIDVPTRQVLIEARIVEASDSFNKNLGVRLGLHNQDGLNGPKLIGGQNAVRYNIGGGLTDTGFHTGQTSTVPDFIKDSMNVDLAAAGLAGSNAGALSFILFNNSGTRLLNLELSALEADGKGKIVSSPRVVTADGIEALIEQGTEIPYQQATSSGATSIAFRKANLSLRVKPQITPDGRVSLSLDVNKDAPSAKTPLGSGSVAIDTKHVKTEVMVENGGTVVIGGIYTQEEQSNVTRIPFFGDLPYVGFMFRNTEKINNKTELLVFITPKVLNEMLSLH